MTLTPGAKLGPYEILSPLGAGGMGEVYRARDPRLDRVVAIKVLPAKWMADEERRRRFVQEARAASALNHPNIVTIHEIESADGCDFIVMECVAGKSLDRLIPRQGMPLGEVLQIAIPIADALARAHARGIVHRDLKPGNVMVGSEGVVKLLDFGLAKLVTPQEAGLDDDTATQERGLPPLSHPGTVAGTVGYMSPEQASGRAVDARTDVFSFGAVLYEMATGRRAFAGDSSADTLAAIMRDQPKAPSEVAPGLSRDLDRLILRCLRKEADRRFQHMLDVKLELEQIKEDSDSSQVAAAPVAARHRRRGLVIAAAVAVAVTGTTLLLLRPRRSPLPPPHVVPLTTTRGQEWRPTFSPDGDQVAFSWAGEKSDSLDIYVKMIGSSEVHRLTSDPAGHLDPSWSPDGRQIAFVHASDEGPSIHLVSPLGGGSDRKLISFPVPIFAQLSWSPDGRWLAVPHYPAREGQEEGGGIYLIPLGAGEPRPITRAPPSGDDKAPAFSPDGRRLAYASCASASGLGSCDVHVVALGPDFLPTGPPRRITRQGLNINVIAWARDGASIVFDGNTGGMEVGDLWRVGVDGDGPPERIELAGHRAFSPAIAPVRDRLAFVSRKMDRAIYRFETGRTSQVFLASSFTEGSAMFSPDGRRIVFESLRSGETSEIWLAAADGSNPKQLTQGPGRWQGAPYWSPDGRRIAFDSQGEDGHWDIWTTDVEGGTPHRLTPDPGNENVPTWSLDGQWVYFSSERSGAREIWRIPATGGPEERVTHGGAGSGAVESGDGKTLLFMHGDWSPLLALPLAGGPERTLVKCTVSSRCLAVGADGIYYFSCEEEPALHLFDPTSGRDRILGKLEKDANIFLTVSPDGKTILYTRMVSEETDLMLIENFR